MTKCSVFIATSLDGFISRPDGSIDWLMKANERMPAAEDCGYSQFISNIDAIIMGRNSIEQVLTLGEWQYKTTPLFVLSRSLKILPKNTPASVSLISGNPNEFVKYLSAIGLKRLYIDGGLTIQSFLKAGLIDEITITVIPVLLGAGKPLFGSLPHDIHLKVLETRTYNFGFVQSKYRVIKKS
jgi:dihydrofolate reductase